MTTNSRERYLHDGDKYRHDRTGAVYVLRFDEGGAYLVQDGKRLTKSVNGHEMRKYLRRWYTYVHPTSEEVLARRLELEQAVAKAEHEREQANKALIRLRMGDCTHERDTEEESDGYVCKVCPDCGRRTPWKWKLPEPTEPNNVTYMSAAVLLDTGHGITYLCPTCGYHGVTYRSQGLYGCNRCGDIMV